MESTNRTAKNIIRLLWAAFLIPVAFAIVMFWMIANEKIGYIPKFEELENPKNQLASRIISSDGIEIGKYYLQNRTIIPYEQIGQNVVNALQATEDCRFPDHYGVDLQALFRVAKGLATGNSSSGGGSTISQQLAKNLYNMREHERPSGLMGKIVMKLQEWVTAVKLERRYTKEEIMSMYLNTVGFGHNAYGIQSASRIFFNKEPKELKLEEASVLVGLLKAPTKYSPKRNPQNSKMRRNTVLSQIEKYQKKLHEDNGFKLLSHSQFDSLRNTDVVIKYTQQTHTEGIAQYFREFLRTFMTATKPDKKNYASYQMETYREDSTNWVDSELYGWCNKNIKPDGTPYNIYNDGLTIYVTINSKMQKYAEEAVEEHIGKGYDALDKHHGSLQDLFETAELKKKASPFSRRLSQAQIDQIMIQSVKRSERWRTAYKVGKLDSATVMKQFKTPTQMTVFSWHGDIDTVMTPWDSILYYKRFLRSGMMSMDPITGYVKAYVGGINYQHFKFDHVSLGRRQVGSTFKPFIYCMAMMHGISPNHMIPNTPYTIDMPGMDPPTYTPRYSASSKDGQMISLRTGLALSLNQISAWVMKQYNPESVIEIVRKLGITAPIDPVPAICVGAAEVKLKEMVAAYCGFANKGMYTEPIYVTKIVDKNGNTIKTFTPKRRQAFDEVTAYKMIYMMRGVIDGGTAGRVRRWFGIKGDVAGKTGTTNLNADGWFMGCTPHLVSGVWTGGEERSIQFTNGYYGQGSEMALPIWGLYMRKVQADKSLGYNWDEKFPEPAGVDLSDAVKEDAMNNNTIEKDSDLSRFSESVDEEY